MPPRRALATSSKDDPYDLERFLTAQNTGRAAQEKYKTALAEIEAGKKKAHWIWYIFPQYTGISPHGESATTKKYTIKSMEEARAYLAHPILGERLVRISRALLEHAGDRTAEEIVGHGDAFKLRSCATLFHAATSNASELHVFKQIVYKFYRGTFDERTIQALPEMEDMWKNERSASDMVLGIAPDDF